MRNLFIPVFLNCWLAKHSLENMFVSISQWAYSDVCNLNAQLASLNKSLVSVLLEKDNTNIVSCHFDVLERPAQGDAKISISLESTTNDPQCHVIVPCLYQVSVRFVFQVLLLLSGCTISDRAASFTVRRFKLPRGMSCKEQSIRHEVKWNVNTVTNTD